MIDYMRVCMIRSCAIPAFSMLQLALIAKVFSVTVSDFLGPCGKINIRVSLPSMYTYIYYIYISSFAQIDWGLITVNSDRFHTCQFRCLRITRLFSGRSIEKTFLLTAESNLFIMENLPKWVCLSEFRNLPNSLLISL